MQVPSRAATGDANAGDCTRAAGFASRRRARIDPGLIVSGRRLSANAVPKFSVTIAARLMPNAVPLGA